MALSNLIFPMDEDKHYYTKIRHECEKRQKARILLEISFRLKCLRTTRGIADS
jgi:hypothetical protein